MLQTSSEEDSYNRYLLYLLTKYEKRTINKEAWRIWVSCGVKL